MMRKEEKAFYTARRRTDPFSFRVMEALRRAATPAVIWSASRAEPGSRGWHRTQERLARHTSVGADMERRNRFLAATLPGSPQGIFVFPDVNICYPQNLHLGNEVFINRGVCIDAPAPVTIGEACLLGPYVVINSGNHSYGDASRRIRDQGHTYAPIQIGRDVWLGAHVVVLAGVTIESGAVVAAGSVVTHNVGADMVVAGTPAVQVGVRGSATDKLSSRHG